MAGCVFGYFADCTVVMPMFAIPLLCRNVGVGMLRYRWRVWALSQALAWLRSPHFIMLTEECQRSYFISRQTSIPIGPLYRSLTWCCVHCSYMKVNFVLTDKENNSEQFIMRITLFRFDHPRASHTKMYNSTSHFNYFVNLQKQRMAVILRIHK